MKASTLIIHGTWAALAVGAFLVGLAPDRRSPSPAEPSGGELEASLRPSPESQKQASWTFGPGDTPAGFSRELASVLSEADEELRKTRTAALMTELTPLVLEGLSAEMISGLLQLFETPGNSDATWHREEDFFRAWTRQNPEAAFAYVTDPKKRAGANSRGRRAVIEAWAEVDMGAAQDALARLEDSSTRHNMGISLMGVLMEADLDAAIAYSAKLHRETQSTSGIYRLARQIREQRGMEGVGEWLEAGSAELGDGIVAYKQEAVEWLAHRGDAAEMAQLLATNADQPFVDSALVLEVARELTRKADDRTRAEMDWIASLPDAAGAKGQALRTRFEEYLQSDFEAAGAWLVGQELAPAYDDAIEIFVRNATMDDVPAAMLWADQISDPDLRAATIEYVRERGG